MNWRADRYEFIQSGRCYFCGRPLPGNAAIILVGKVDPGSPVERMEVPAVPFARGYAVTKKDAFANLL